MGIPSSPETPRRSQAQRVKSTLGTRGLGKHSRQDNTSKPDDGFAFKKSQPVDNNLPNLPIPRPARQYDLASASRVTAFANSNRPFDMRETPQEWLEYHGSILMAKSKQMKKQKTNLVSSLQDIGCLTFLYAEFLCCMNLVSSESTG